MAAKKSKSPKPKNAALYSRVKAEAKKKFDVYPSAYANKKMMGGGKVMPKKKMMYGGKAKKK